MQATNYLFFLALLLCTGVLPAQNPALVPLPASVSRGTGTYALPATVNVVAEDPDAARVAEFLTDFLEVAGHPTSLNGTGTAAIRLRLTDDADGEAEGYHLLVDDAGVTVEASARAGLFYGVQTLFQLIGTEGAPLPYVEIEDAPRFAYRGMHLDVGRYMFPVDFIKKYIDLMAHFKFNTFHWHLTEDQGWRIEIKQYPRLQEVAAYRDETVEGRAQTRDRGQETFDHERYGGYYTQEEVKEVVAYATDRSITVVPEIELPGHARAALAAYPYLGCEEGAYETAETWGVFPEIYCAGKESTFEFLENVFREVLPLFPGKYVHIGGDEAPKDRWESCPHCQKRMEEEGLENEHELQSYFVQRMEKFLNEQGKTMIGWDEILEGGLAQNAVVMSWRGEAGGIEAAKQGHDVIMTPTDWCYFDYAQADPATEPLGPQAVITVEKVYGYEPLPEELTAEQQTHILGAQANLWTEYVKTPEHAEYMAYPRALALAEVVWSPQLVRDYASFVQRVKALRPLLDRWEVNYATHIFGK